MGKKDTEITQSGWGKTHLLRLMQQKARRAGTSDTPLTPLGIPRIGNTIRESVITLRENCCIDTIEVKRIALQLPSGLMGGEKRFGLGGFEI